jgi:IPT/TIG domain-containing protein
MIFSRRLFATIFIGALTVMACSGGSTSVDSGFDADGFGDADGQASDGDDLSPDGDSADADQGPIELAVQGVLPSRGPIEGGTWANIIGSGFVNGISDSPFDVRDVTDVTFGDNSAIDIEIIRDDMISVRTPAGIAGQTSVTVENPNGRFELINAFTYFDTVTTETVEPVDLSVRGGTRITVSGTGFSEDTTVLVAGQPCSAINVTDSTTLSATTPPGPEGSADVEIVNRNGRSLLFRAVSYHPVPRLDSITPAAGTIDGSTPISAEGEGFEELTQLLFDNKLAGNIVFSSSDLLEAETPIGQAGSVDVVAAGPVDSSLLPGGFIYLPELQGSLTVTGVAPRSGPAEAGNTATVVGEGFSATVTGVRFGGNLATDLHPIDDRMIQVTVPQGNPGLVGVSVRTLTEEVSLDDAYRYYQQLQTTSISPQAGPVAGGTNFIIQGNGFHSGVEVFFGGVLASGVVVTSPTELGGTTPPGTAGPIDVLIKDTDSEALLPAAFSYTTDLSLLRVDPDYGAMAGGTYVTCYGEGFGPGMRIWFGPEEGQVIQVLSSSIITARTPRGDPGEVNVRVEKGEENFELENGFAYIDPTNDRGGASGGPLDGSLNITALDGSYTKYGEPVEDATVLIDQPAISGLTDDRGQVTFSGPSLVKALTVTIAKEGYEAVTVVNLNAANLTVYLYPNEREPITTQPGELKTADLSGRVFGFKDIPELPSGPLISMQARVNLTSYSIYSVPPYGGIPGGQAIETDGGSYQFTLRLGNYSVYSLFGAYDESTDTFTPALLGLKRSITLINEEPVEGQDIVLSTYLDQSVPVHLEDPPLGDGETEAKYSAYVSLDLGWDGVIYLAQDESLGTELLLEGLPSAASNSFIFVGLASLGGGYPFSYTFRRQEGEIGDGVTLGPFLGFTQIVEPEKDGEMVDGRIAWTIEGPQPELIEVLIETNELIPNVLWRVILPGDATEITLPEELISLLPRGEPLIMLVYTANSPRFYFDRFNYSQLSSGRWTSYTINYTIFTAP